MAGDLMEFEKVKQYIDENVLHSEAFDTVDELKQKKAVNHAKNMLYRLYPKYKPEENPLPVDAIAFQAIYILTKDDSSKRTEDGATYIGFNGVALTYAQVNRSVSPDVIRILGRRIGSYSLYTHDTRRDIFKQ